VTCCMVRKRPTGVSSAVFLFVNFYKMNHSTTAFVIGLELKLFTAFHNKKRIDGFEWVVG
jgi:hypothetical protein